MAEYISRGAVLEILKRQNTPNRSPAQKDMLRRAASDVLRITCVEAAPVRHGRWEKFRLSLDDYAERLKCSNCCYVVYEQGFSYCPNCGARMDLGGADDA